jgi:S-adenosylmethionine:tRNA ribosyltransferase-isomerase
MIAATWPRDDARSTRLLIVDPGSGAIEDRPIGALRLLLREGDLLVVNDAATLPASLRGIVGTGAEVEARLIGQNDDGSWSAVLFGAGDWRVRTEDRPSPPRVNVGEVVQFDRLRATIVGVDDASPRLATLAFEPVGAAFWRALYRAGHPVQYSYTARPFALWHVQTPFAARPWASEPPSAGFAFTWELLLNLRRSGIGVARITHAAGLSSTGDEALDARLPFAERYEVSDETAAAVRAAKERGGRVIAVGTTVARALESAARAGGGTVVASAGTTDLLLGPHVTRLVVDGIVTGVHEPGTSHYTLLESFAPRALLDRAHMFAEALEYTGHEFGDAVLVLDCRKPRSREASVELQRGSARLTDANRDAMRESPLL